MTVEAASPDVVEARRQYEAGRYDAALELAARALRSDEADRSRAQLVNAAVLIDRGASDDAERALDDAESAADDSDVVLETACLRAVLASQQGRRAATAESARDAERLGVARPHPRRGSRLLALLESLARVGADNAAWTIHGRLRRDVDGELVTSLATASLHARQGDPAIALSACREASRHPALPERDRWRLHLLRALAERRGQDPAAATTVEDALDRAVQLDGLRLVAARDAEVAGQLLHLARQGDELAEKLALPPRVEIHLLGDFCVLRGGQPQPAPSAAARQLIGLIAIGGGHAATEQVCSWLWPVEPADVAAACLRNLLRRLRARIGPVVQRDEDELTFAPWVEVDLIQFNHEADRVLRPDPLVHKEHARALVASACLRYQGVLLPLDPQADWATSARLEAADRFRRVAALRLRHLVEAGRDAEADRFRQHLRTGRFNL